jgi:RNA polymerase sigma factor (sigma-70 family)
MPAETVRQSPTGPHCLFNRVTRKWLELWELPYPYGRRIPFVFRETFDIDEIGLGMDRQRMTILEIQYWFTREVLPLEPGLTRFLRRRWRNQSEIADLRQEIYARLCDAARSGTPKQVKPFIFAVARNLIIDLARRAPAAQRLSSASGEAMESVDLNTPVHEAMVLQDMRILQDALNQLPSRCLEVLRLRKLEGLSQRETAARMGITENTVERQMVKAMQKLTLTMKASAYG